MANLYRKLCGDSFPPVGDFGHLLYYIDVDVIMVSKQLLLFIESEQWLYHEELYGYHSSRHILMNMVGIPVVGRKRDCLSFCQLWPAIPCEFRCLVIPCIVRGEIMPPSIPFIRRHLIQLCTISLSNLENQNLISFCLIFICVGTKTQLKNLS